ncbi:MAG: DNA polymerase III subunit gamma/tau [Gemmatimonadota bacterium]|nr:DNA polymerase III subunit gamma/tau [Gemmatimonadota bacterium]
MYISLARKYRPKRFADVAVQSHVSNTLKGAIARGRVAHGYLLCGPRGVGKTTLARVLAMALNCEHKTEDGEPCGVCTSCTRIWTGSTSLDVVEIDAASNRGVDDARDLRERAMYAPSGDNHYKVYIVDEAHMLTREAWNALLKVLEEPPPRVVFVFATTEPQKIAQAAAPVLSRLQRFDFKRIGPADVRTRLAAVLAAENVEATPDALAMLARAADGSMRDALSLTDQTLSLGESVLTAERVREALGLIAEDEYLAIYDLIAGRDAGAIFPAVARLVDAGADLGAFLGGLADIFRAALALALGDETGGLAELSDRTRESLVERGGRLSAGDLLRMLSAITELEPRFRRSGQQQMLVETMLVRFALMDRTVSLEEVLRGLGPDDGSSGDDDSRGAPRAPRVAPPRVPAPTSAPTSSPAASSVSAPPAERPPITVAALRERWEALLARLRTDGRMTLVASLEHATPVDVSPSGEITFELTGDLRHMEEPITNGAKELLSVIGSMFEGATRIKVRVPAALPAREGATRRLSAEAVKAERLSSLRRRDPSLDAAVRELDLELMD